MDARDRDQATAKEGEKVDMSTKAIIKLTRDLLWIAKCPDTDCDNEGTVDEHNGSCHQCQWCYERDKVCRHTHSSIGKEKGDDSCAGCGRDLRDRIHLRVGE